MAEDDGDDSQKTEDPTPKKIQEARKKGQVAMSRELNNWAMLFAGTMFVAVFSGPLMMELMNYLRGFIEHSGEVTEGGILELVGDTVGKVLIMMGLPLLLFFVIAILAPLLQIGLLFAPDIIKMDMSKISPMKGFFRLVSMRSLVEFVKGIFKLFLVGLVGTMIVMPYFDKLEHLIDVSPLEALGEMRFLVLKMMVGVLIILLLIAVADLVYQRREYMKKMRMSRQDIRDEYKQSEGDPHIKAKLRQMRMQKARQRMMQAVPTADVVITNPTHYSIALKYNPEEMAAPVVVAKGIDEVALRIREIAKENNIILFENKPLARALYDVAEIDEVIPTEHFKAVAEVISYVFKIKGKLKS